MKKNQRIGPVYKPTVIAKKDQIHYEEPTQVKDKDYSRAIDLEALRPNERTPWMKRFMEE